MATRKIYFDEDGCELSIFENEINSITFEITGDANTPDGIATIHIALAIDDVKELIIELQQLVTDDTPRKA